MAVACLSLAVLYAVPANAVHDTGRFQLEGDAESSTPANATGDDWDRVCHQVTVTKDKDGAIPDECTSASDTTNGTAVSWTAEANPSASIFTGGGSKDPIDIGSWAWKDAGGLPDKDNLLHSFAVRYSLPVDPVDVPGGTGNLGNGTACPAKAGATTCELLYFGSDRFDNSGDAQQGFWFFQNRITTAGAKSGGGTGFTGVHKNGDILVISDFSNGGGTSTITVYRWDSSCAKTGATASDGTPCGDANLATLESSANAKCSSNLAAGDPFCGIVNSANGTKAPWAYTDKSGNSTYLNGEFYEGGINLSLLPGNIASECFASVASETRSSTSTTAVLKDFILGNFGDCSATLATQVSSASVNPGTAVHDTLTVTSNQTSVLPSGTITWFLCSFAAGSTTACDGSTGKTGDNIGTSSLSGSGGIATADSPNVNTTGAGALSPGRYCFRAEWPGDDNFKPVSPATKFTEYGGANGTNECFTVVQSPTTTTTHPRVSGSTTNLTTAVAVGTKVVDYARIAGATGFGLPTGTVNFYVCSPSQTTGTSGAERCLDPNGSAVSGNPQTATQVSGSATDTEATSGEVTASQVGVWCFRADYISNTANYTNSSDSSHTECFLVKDSTSLTTAQNWLPNDSATITSAGATSLSGELNFTLYDSADCTGTILYREDTDNVTAGVQGFQLSSAASPATRSTSNTAVKVSASKTVSWKVVFTSSSDLVTSPPSSSECVESTALTITNSAP